MIMLYALWLWALTKRAGVALGLAIDCLFNMLHGGSLTAQIGDGAGMIEMSVRNQDLLERDPLLLHDAEHAVEIAAGIDDGALHGFVAPQNRAVLGERRDGDGGGFQHRRFADLVHDM